MLSSACAKGTPDSEQDRAPLFVNATRKNDMPEAPLRPINFADKSLEAEHRGKSAALTPLLKVVVEGFALELYATIETTEATMTTNAIASAPLRSRRLRDARRASLISSSAESGTSLENSLRVVEIVIRARASLAELQFSCIERTM
jgi:hypothetical protein